MFASQLIYTGCGKEKTGDFTVWSKTLDISKGEENEIHDKMLYKRPAKLPYEPTQEELDTLFPKKFGFFYLSTGKACLAQSVYIGKVYSDQDNRTGNYIIHAFVFDKDEDIIPMNFIESDMFKRGLTYEEWHEGDAPNELEKVEIQDMPNSLTKQDIDSFFNDERISRLKMLLQAILNSSQNDQKITFYDAHDNLKYWYKAISVCVPKHMHKKLTFNTFFIPGTPLPSHNQANLSPINTEIKIRNIFPAVASTFFNYQQDARAGKYSFDFESDILPANIEISSYVNAVADKLRTNVFGTVMLVDSVEKIGKKCGVDLNTALDIHYLLTGQISLVDDFEKLKALIKYTMEFYSDSLQSVADNLYEYGIKSEKWELSSEISEIYRFVFDYSEAADKGEMIHLYVVNQGNFGVRLEARGSEYCNSFKEHAPFAWINFLDYIFDGDNCRKYFETNGLNFNSRFLVFDTLAESLSEISEVQEQKSFALKYFVDTAKLYIQNEELDEVLDLVECMGKCGQKWKAWIVEKSYSVLCKDEKRISDVCSPNFTLNLAEVCGDMPLAVSLISGLVEENEDDNEFIKLYVNRYDKKVSFYTDVLKNLKAEPKYETFFLNVELYRFAVSPIVTKKQLQNYYNDYFSVGKDSCGLFVKKLKQYLSGTYGIECINEGLSCYDLWFKDKIFEPDVLNSCITVICEAVFSVPVDVLKGYISTRGTKRLKEIRHLAVDYKVPSHYYVISFGENLKRLNDEIRSRKKSPYVQEALDKLEKGEFYSSHLEEEKSKEMFVKMYLPEVIRLYLTLSDEKNFEDVYTKIFEPLYSAKSFGQCFYDELNNLKEKEYSSLLSDTLICSCSKFGIFNEYLSQIVESVLEDMGRGKRKKFFAQLLDDVPKNYEKKTKAYVEAYQKEHDSFLNKLFGSLKKKDEDEEDSSERPAEDDKKKWKK